MGIYGVEDDFWVGEYHFEVSFSNDNAVGLCQRDVTVGYRRKVEDLALSDFTGQQLLEAYTGHDLGERQQAFADQAEARSASYKEARRAPHANSTRLLRHEKRDLKRLEKTLAISAASMRANQLIEPMLKTGLLRGLNATLCFSRTWKAPGGERSLESFPQMLTGYYSSSPFLKSSSSNGPADMPRGSWLIRSINISGRSSRHLRQLAALRESMLEWRRSHSPGMRFRESPSAVLAREPVGWSATRDECCWCPQTMMIARI
jgi:hypothetical protein